MRESWASIGAPGPPPTRRGGKRMIARSWAVALMLAVSAPVWAATSQQHVAAARAAEKRSNWRKALREWQAAYRTEINAEYLISIGDAFAHLGRRAEARKQYTAYLADPLALPANAARIKGKIAALEAPRTAKRAAAKEAPVPLPLPELDLPGAKPAAKKTDLALALPELPGPSASDPGTEPPAVAGQPAASKPVQTVAAVAPSSAVQPAVAKPATPPESRKAPAEVLAAVESPRGGPTATGGG